MSTPRKANPFPLRGTIARPEMVRKRIEILVELNESRERANGDPRKLKIIAQKYRQLGAVQTAAEIEKGL